MGNLLIVFVAVGAFIAMLGGWVLMAAAQWHVWMTVITTAPLLVMLILMLNRKPVVFFYAALLSMPYLATAITQLVISDTGRGGAMLCLGAGLCYLAVLALTLRALKSLPRSV